MNHRPYVIELIHMASIGIQVNNAAQIMLKPATEYTGEDYAWIMATNLESCFDLRQLAHPLLRIASVAGRGGA
jgi:Tropinone reductase 1